ncbi:hypothetical protein MKK88_05190 [Methylobacterium sp. E-005]|uniref:hypothetical protein n=1 Tax=Methylobacterium sp. E-005 TaxID=2836549 RepID=UPI001FBA43AB|nr:hypothetical protein [Methylobacterium sp. E-005]MCJ2085388.1 hypothetical protein [Methylobacterium sp. E-005]
MRLKMFCSAAAIAAFACATTVASAQEGGPCTDDIAKLKRDLGTQVGMGAPVSQPDAGQQKGPNAGSAGQTADTTGMTAAESGHDKPRDGVTREGGGSPGTVGGVAGPVAAATGTAQANAVANGQVATSPADVRAQSENKPTAAAKAAQGEAPSTSANLSSEDKISQAKSALQRATDLNAKGDQSCRDAVQEARNLLPQSSR